MTTSTATTVTTAPVTAEGILAGIERLRALRRPAEERAQSVAREVWGLDADGATALAMVELCAAYVAAGGKL